MNRKLKIPLSFKETLADLLKVKPPNSEKEDDLKDQKGLPDPRMTP
jgi:hypothetical protein